MAKDIPDFMREFDTDVDYGFTPVSSKPKDETISSIVPKLVEDSNLEIAKVKSDVSDIKSMMNEIMQIVAEKDQVTKTLSGEQETARFKDIEKLILPFLYNLMKSDEPYIHWPNRSPIIKAQVEKLMKLTRGN
jgi:phosphotransferase system HPr-like phosphotransfer protein